MSERLGPTPKSKGLFEDVADPDKRAAMVAGFLAMSGCPSGRTELKKAEQAARASGPAADGGVA